MKDNVILLALKNDHNLGDKIICDCMAQYLKSVLPETTELRVIDLEGDEIDLPLAGHEKIIRKFILFAEALLKIRGSRLLIGRKNKAALMKKIVSAKVTNAAQHLYNAKTKCVIFAGGGIVKYKYQYFHFFIDAFTKVADEKKIPVMLSGVGVEGYDENNVECQLLKAALNRNCVKVITTRDDIDCLENNYKMRSDLILEKVADPACACSDFFEKTMIKCREKKKIGLGITRGGLFADNGIDFSETEQIHLWKQIIEALELRNYSWEFFTNGLDADQKFANKIIESLHINEDKLAQQPVKSKDLVNLICQYDATLVCRLHASIVSYAYDIPTVGLVWNDKQKMFGESIGIAERFIEKKLFAADYVVDVLEKAMREQYKQTNKGAFSKTAYIEIDNFLERFVNM